MDQPLTPTPPPPAFTQAPVEPEQFKKSYTWLIVAVIAFLLAGSSVLAYKYYQLKQQVTQTQTSPIPTPSAPASPAADPTVNWKTYEDKKWGFSVKYPEEFFTACYPEEGLKLWGPNFDCNVPHDIFYTISAIGYEDKDYKPYKKASKTEPLVIAGRNATKNTYIFDESDGPLFGLHEETEIVIPLQSGLIQLVVLGQETKNKVFFSQILSTFKFLGKPSKCLQVEDPCNPQACNYDQSKCNK